MHLFCVLWFTNVRAIMLKNCPVNKLPHLPTLCHSCPGTNSAALTHVSASMVESRRHGQWQPSADSFTSLSSPCLDSSMLSFSSLSVCPSICCSNLSTQIFKFFKEIWILICSIWCLYIDKLFWLAAVAASHYWCTLHGWRQQASQAVLLSHQNIPVTWATCLH